MRREKAKGQQHENYARQLVDSYQQQFGFNWAENVETAHESALKLVNIEKDEQVLRSFVQRILLLIHAAKMSTRNESVLHIPPATFWFDPDYPENILAQQDKILNACF